MEYVCVCAQSLSPVRLYVTPWTVARQTPLSMGFPTKGILEWVVIPSSRGIFLTRRWNLRLLHWQADTLPLSHLGSLYQL